MNVFYFLIIYGSVLLILWGVRGLTLLYISRKNIKREEKKTFSLEEFEKSLNQPLHWWMEAYYWLYRTWNSLCHLPKKIKYFIQRGKRGWSDEDVWGFNDYIAKVISQVVRVLEKKHFGYPAGNLGKALFHDDSAEDKAWTNTLGEIAKGFEMYLALDDLVYVKDGKLDEEAMQRGKEITARAQVRMMLLIKHFDDLWD